MDDSELQTRISRIETQWNLLRDAHGDDTKAERAVETLLVRYRRAIYVYLLGALRSADAADDVFQEFALRFVKGAFRNAQPEKGRFRNLIKASLGNLIADHRRRQNRGPAELQGESALPARDDQTFDEDFVRQWRETVLANAWTALAAETGDAPYYDALKHRANHPDATTEDMARDLAVQFNRPLTPASLRQILHRARAKFAQLLIDEVRRSLDAPDPERLHDEIEELGLLPYCKSALKGARSE